MLQKVLAITCRVGRTCALAPYVVQDVVMGGVLILLLVHWKRRTSGIWSGGRRATTTGRGRVHRYTRTGLEPD